MVAEQNAIDLTSFLDLLTGSLCKWYKMHSKIVIPLIYRCGHSSEWYIQCWSVYFLKFWSRTEGVRNPLQSTKPLNVQYTVSTWRGVQWIMENVSLKTHC